MGDQQTAYAALNCTDLPVQKRLAALSPDQMRFAIARLRCSSKKEAAEEIGVSYSTVRHWPDEVDEVVDLLLLDTVAAARALMVCTLAQAMAVKVRGLESKDEKVKQAAASELLDRTLGRASQSLDLHHSISNETRKFMAELVGLGESTGEDESPE